MAETFDFIVIGGGSGGCIAASEIAAAGHSVLLLEAGQAAEENPETLRADGYKEAFINDRLMFDRFSEPQAALGGRRIFLGTGRGMGGSGSINAMVYTRGAREDFEAWGTGWRWDDVVSHFEDLEAVLGPRPRPPTDFTERCLLASEHAGFRRKENLNDGDLSGVLGYEHMNYRGNDRRSAYVSFIKDRDLPALTVRTEASAVSIGFDVGRRARRVQYQRGGMLETVEARREIIVAAGALATPKLLLLSGVGPTSELRPLGVEVVADVPGVGKNLHDHPNIQLFFLAKQPLDCNYPQLYGFHHVGPTTARDGQSDACFVFYPARSSFREGLMRMLPAMVLPPKAYAGGTGVRLMRGAIDGLFRPALVRNFIDRMWGIVVILGKPKSRGSLTLASSRAEDAAVIDPAYLEHPDDVTVLMNGVAKARRIARGMALAALGNTELIPGMMGQGDEAVLRSIKQNIMTTYHFAGTCKMGDDATAVVDRRLVLRGVSGVRIADASIIPETPVSAMNAPSMMVGLRAARFALEDARGA